MFKVCGQSPGAGAVSICENQVSADGCPSALSSLRRVFIATCEKARHRCNPYNKGTDGTVRWAASAIIVFRAWLYAADLCRRAVIQRLGLVIQPRKLRGITRNVAAGRGCSAERRNYRL